MLAIIAVFSTSRNGNVDLEQVAKHKLYKWSLFLIQVFIFIILAVTFFPQLLCLPNEQFYQDKIIGKNGKTQHW